MPRCAYDVRCIGAKKSSIVNECVRATLEQSWTGSLGSSGVLRDCNDLKPLTGCADYIPNSFAHQRPCHWGYEGNRTALRVRFVLSHDTIFLYAPIAALKVTVLPKATVSVDVGLVMT